MNGEILHLEFEMPKVDPFELMHDFLVHRNEKILENFHCNPLSVEEVASIFGVSTSGYYAWVQRQNDPVEQEKRKKAEEEEKYIKDCMLEILRGMTYIPGARTFMAQLYRRYQLEVGRNKCEELMRAMNLVANTPKKDAYKYMATHDHPGTAPVENKVNRNFYIGPRKVILTDITYCYYGYKRTPFYICVFRDAFTKELLGWCCSRRMTVESLVIPAYNMMMKNHAHELKKSQVFVHSDQGSHYTSTTYQKLLEQDGLEQSMSRRGNSWDNAPMESFFGRMKTNMLDNIARCRDFETAEEMINGYFHAYNTEHYQYSLAGLTPYEFYLFATTGIYPCGNYYGVDSSRLIPLEEIREMRRKAADDAARKARERAQERRGEGAVAGDPEKVVLRDIRITEKEIAKIEEKLKKAKERLEFLQALLKKAEKALEFVRKASPELKEALKNYDEWKKHPELNYIFDMKGMF